MTTLNVHSLLFTAATRGFGRFRIDGEYPEIDSASHACCFELRDPRDPTEPLILLNWTEASVARRPIILGIGACIRSFEDAPKLEAWLDSHNRNVATLCGMVLKDDCLWCIYQMQLSSRAADSCAFFEAEAVRISETIETMCEYLSQATAVFGNANNVIPLLSKRRPARI